MKIPDSIMARAAEAASAFPSATDAIAALGEAIRDLPEWKAYVAESANLALAHAVYQVRSKNNAAIRAQVTAPAAIPNLEGVIKAVRSAFSYCIAGTQIGLVTGSMLPRLRDTEAAKANTHAWNAKLLQALATRVPTHQTVKQSLSEEELVGLMRAAGVPAEMIPQAA